MAASKNKTKQNKKALHMLKRRGKWRDCQQPPTSPTTLHTHFLCCQEESMRLFSHPFPTMRQDWRNRTDCLEEKEPSQAGLTIPTTPVPTRLYCTGLPNTLPCHPHLPKQACIANNVLYFPAVCSVLAATLTASLILACGFGQDGTGPGCRGCSAFGDSGVCVYMAAALPNHICLPAHYSLLSSPLYINSHVSPFINLYSLF